MSIYSVCPAILKVAAGMSYIGRMKYVHRNLHAVAVLVDQHNVWKITGFFVAALMKNDEFKTDEGWKIRLDKKFPLKWTALEAFQDGRFTVKSDVWSFGVLLAEIASRGEIPYPGEGAC